MCSVPFENSQIREAFEQLEQSVERIVEEFRDDVVALQTTHLVESLNEVRDAALAGLERIEQACKPSTAPSEHAEVVEDVKTSMVRWLVQQCPQNPAKERLIKTSRLRSFLTALDRAVEQQQPFDVELERGLFDATEDDSSWTRFLKWTRRAKRSLRGSSKQRGESTRHVPIRDLAAFYVGGPFGIELNIAANSLAIQRIDLWRWLRNIFERLEGVYQFVQQKIDADESISVADLESAREELTEEFSVVQRELKRSGDRIVSQLGRRLTELQDDAGRAATISGTAQLPRRRYDPRKIQQARRRHRLSLRENVLVWDSIHRMTATAFQLRLDGSLFLSRFENLRDECLREICEKVTVPLFDYPNKVVSLCSEALQRIETAFDNKKVKPAKLKSAVSAEHKLLEELINQEAVPKLVAAVKPHNANKPFEGFFEKIEHELVELEPTYTTRIDPWVQLVWGEPPEPPNVVDFPFRELAREVIKDEVRLRFEERQHRISQLFREEIDALTEMARFLAVQFEASETALDDENGPVDMASARDAATTSLQKTIERATNLASQGLEFADEMAIQLSQVTQEQAALLYDILKKCDADEARRRSGLAEAGLRHKETHDSYQRVDEPPDFARTPFGGDWAARLSQLKSWGRAHLGLQVITDERLTELAARASFEHFESVGIPRTYRRLFETAAFGVEDILAGQQQELDELARLAKLWRSGTQTSVVVNGGPGSGRTTLLERGLRLYLPDASINRRVLSSRVRSREDLAIELSRALFGESLKRLSMIRQRVEKDPTPRVVVLERLELLMLRTHNGLEPLKLFFDFIDIVGPSILWLVTVESAAWNFMDTYLRATDHVSKVIHVAPLTRTETEQLVMRRHQVSGRKVVFNRPGQSSDGEKQTSRRAEDSTASQARFFDSLYQASSGYPLLSLYLWLNAITRDSDRQLIRVTAPVALTPAWIHHLGTEKLLELATIMMHGGVTVDEFAAVNRVEKDAALAALNHLSALNLLTRSDVDPPSFLINRVLYKPIHDALEERNLI